MKLPSLDKVFGSDKIEASSKDGASSPASTSNKNAVSTAPVSQTSSTSYGDFDQSMSIENSATYSGVGDGITQRGTTTSDGSPLTGAQAGAALGVGAAAIILKKTGALGNSADTQETINAAGQAFLENQGISSATASSVLAAANGDKNAKLDVGLKAASVLSGGLISEQFGNTVSGALQGDKNAQRTLVVGAVNVLTDESSPLAPAVTAVKSATRSVIDDIFPVGSSLRNLASDIGSKFGSGKTGNDAPADAPPVIVSSAGVSRLQKARERKDPLFSFDWKVEIPDIGCPNITVKADTFNFYVEEASVTLPNFQNTDVFRCGTRKNYPGFSDTGSLSLVFYEDREMNATTYIDYWRSKIQNRTNASYSLPTIYKQDIRVICYDAKGNVVGLFTAKGCYPGNQGPIALQSSASDRVTRSVEIITDGVFFTKYINGSPVGTPTAVTKSGPLNQMKELSGLLKTALNALPSSNTLSKLSRFV